MLGTARDIALGMHHLHLDGIVHGGELHQHCFSVKQSCRVSSDQSRSPLTHAMVLLCCLFLADLKPANVLLRSTRDSR
jgi:hypothetical protein